MSNGSNLAKTTDGSEVLEQVIIKGDLAQLEPEERVQYYKRVCESVGLNPFTQPFAYIRLNNKLTLYALKGATDQLRSLHGVSIEAPKVDYVDDLIIVSVIARDKTGRTDADTGAVTIGGLKGEAKANAIMKAITKAKRRVTLSMCGLGMLDETEVETIPEAKVWTEPVQPESPSEPVQPAARPKTAAEPVEAQARPDTAANAVWMAWRKADDAVLWAGDQTDAKGVELFSHYNHVQASFNKAKDEYSNSLTDAEKPKADDSHEVKWTHARALFKYFFERTEAKKQGETLVLPTAGSQRIFEDIDEGDAVPFNQLGKGDYQNAPPGPQGT